ncbi:Osmotically-inducible protein OsmY, contains BON domain [Variovorax sp. OK605]|uniref:BON domain-containing protein n=1 Tax=Variovorax sp. OK605 TaxID=1855317 RepID=UPI0008E5EB00|nr:BON domain-containing protein [Variovorax sp. OK605]SFQ59869.1 Osmotically-inducible protein OsmY, contains BON domain [Variovorax sp. OK605]
MKTDAQLRNDMQTELAWEPAVTSGDVDVIVKNGVVTLIGHLLSHAEKYAVERAVQRVHGVKALAIEMDVQLPSGHARTDAEIAAAAERALEWNMLMAGGKVRPTVDSGWLTLEGEVKWEYRRSAAKSAVRTLTGVRGVSNTFRVTPKVRTADVARQIHDAPFRQADSESRHIAIALQGAQVTLSGTVHSWAERGAVQDAAWAAPGVAVVVNDLRVEH